MDQLLFLNGPSEEENRAVLDKLHGNLPYLNREPSPSMGEKPMTLLDGRTVIASGFREVTSKIGELRAARNKERAAAVR